MKIFLTRNISSQFVCKCSWLPYMEDFSSKPASCSSSSVSMPSLPEKTRLKESSVSLRTKYESPVMDVVTPGCGVGGGLGGGGGFGRKCGKGGDPAGHGSGSMDLHYQNLIEADPGNSMILCNYARYLSEFQGDVVKAKVYYERALLANPGDGSVLSSYAELVWQADEDGKRAQGYFDQAVRASPDDSFVWASYARFLWDE